MQDQTIFDVVAVGAHPDDYEYGCSASLVKHIQRGDKVCALILSDGKLGHHPLDMIEAKRAAEILGIQAEILRIHGLFFGNFPDGNIQVTTEVISFLRRYIKQGVRRVYAPISDDEHPDHENTARAVQRVAPLVVPEFLLYEGPRNRRFNPDYYIEIGKDALEKKVMAYETYQSQSARGALFHDVREMARFRGSRAGLKYAEAFEVYRITRKGDLL